MDTSVCSSKGLTTEDGCVFTASSDTVLSHNLLTDSEDILVYGLQGKSQYPGVWSLSSLIASNKNLVEVDPNRQDDDIGFILPQEGIDKALCSKALLLSLQNKTYKRLPWKCFKTGNKTRFQRFNASKIRDYWYIRAKCNKLSYINGGP